MAQYPRPILQRPAQAMASWESRIRKLESRTSSIDSGWPLAVLPGVIDSGYVPGGPPAAHPMVYLNGATVLSGPYGYLSSYTPAAGDHVLLAPVGAQQAYYVIGKTL